MLQGFHHAALSTPGLDRLVAFYRSLCGGHPGIFDFSSPESRPGDPDGNIIELLEFGPSGRASRCSLPRSTGRGKAAFSTGCYHAALPLMGLDAWHAGAAAVFADT